MPMMFKVQCLATMALSLLLASARADDEALMGVWDGTIGTSRVRVCFASDASEYYYHSQLRGISLRLPDNEPAATDWEEYTQSTATGSWKDLKVTDKILDGQWHSQTGAKKLNIKLKKFANLEQSGNTQYCGSAFTKPIVDDVAKFKGISAFELPATYKGARVFNTYVRNWLAEQAVEAYECHKSHGQDREITQSVKFLNDKILVVDEMLFDVYCGGAHNVSGSRTLIFDPQTGREINTWKWIKGGEDATRESEPRTRLRSIIEKLNPAVEESSDGCRSNFSVDKPYPTKGGFEFPTNYSWAARACKSSVLIPYKRLAPFLTPAGAAVAASFSRK